MNAPLFHFSATNHAGQRLTWYFDRHYQCARAYAMAGKHAYAKRSWITTSERRLLPADDFITDATEFAQWLTGEGGYLS